MARKLDNLSALDWDDSALIRAYNKGMSLRVKDLEAGNSNEKKQDPKKKEWKVGDFCQALYPGDDLMYEARIISLSDGICVVDFLGYDEELEVDIDTLTESRGKKSRKKQIRKANRSRNQSYHIASADESASGDDVRNSISSPVYSKKKVHHSSQGNHVFNHSVDYTAAESTFQTMYPTPAHCNAVPPPSMMVPPFPPMPHCSDLSQNSSLTAMMTSWYMAGYYTGLHQVQKNQRCCCYASQNCCRH